MGRLDGKVAVITGGAGGIGRATGQRFVDEGARVVLADRDEEAVQEAAATLGAPDHVATVAGDVSTEEANAQFVQTARDAFGGLDIFVANAGIEGVHAPLTDYPLETFDQVLAVNVRGVFLGLRHAFPALTERGGGSIIITSSVAGVQGTGQVSAYTTSKHAVVGLMREAAREGAPHNIRVNTVHPGPVDNRMMRSLESGFAPDDPAAAKKQFEAAIPLNRYADNDDVARAMLYLASDESAYITGARHMVDGGMTA
ncbi:SDR family NAD(P)-dependent oxidoreductase [Salisaeta longa]|uniref:SDR family NAD(P)-dependent oxidoreductase n=1 Tax=Salisaeta longa TaxID=503170 RepID=UPI0003B7B921|nr:SDR family oxidoreductase [Salisaeta longa]